MSIVRANVTFDHGGRQIRAGEAIDTSHYLYQMFPTRFTSEYGAGTALTDQSGGTATAGGTIAAIVAGTDAASSAGLVSTQNAIASLGAAIAAIQARLTS